jgi:hypothetical protein
MQNYRLNVSLRQRIRYVDMLGLGMMMLDMPDDSKTTDLEEGAAISLIFFS